MTEKVQSLGLWALTALALVGVFATFMVKGSVPDQEWTIVLVLVGAVAGVQVPRAVAPLAVVAPASALTIPPPA